jgi:hypothetical protein
LSRESTVLKDASGAGGGAIRSRSVACGSGVSDHAGTIRFVFGVTLGKPMNSPMQCSDTCPFAISMDYRMPAKTEADVLAWAQRWHALGALPASSEEFNAALQAITDRVTSRGSEPERPNGSALRHVLSSDQLLGSSSLLEHRAFALATDGSLRPTLLEQTPDSSRATDANVLAFVNENEAAILAEQDTVPELYRGTPFLGAAAYPDLLPWWDRVEGIRDNEASHKFQLHTCGGCHSSSETGFSSNPIRAVAAISGRRAGEISSGSFSDGRRSIRSRVGPTAMVQ